jgi:bacterioferritin (cytochrome b1)
MKGDAKVIEFLNIALKNELTAIAEELGCHQAHQVRI